MNHAITLRNVLCGGLIYAALGLVQIANAGFAQLNPPPEFQTQNNQHSFRPSNQSPFIDGSARMNATLNAAGRIINVPVYTRVSAANAPQYAARFLFRHPLVTAAAAASILVPMGVEWVNGVWVQTQPSQNIYPISEGFTYIGIRYNIRIDHLNTAQATCQAMIPAATNAHGFPVRLGTVTFGQNFGSLGYSCQVIRISNNQIVDHIWIDRRENLSCPAGWFITPAGCVQNRPPVTRPLTEEEFVPLVAPQIQPAQVPNIVPNTVPIPVEVPTINPAPRTVPVPYTPPVPRPLIVPLSDPVPIPNTEPQQWRQPLVEINPSPTAANPWRVSLNPKERITTSPHGITDPVSDLDPATPAQPSAQSDFCIRNPEVLACARVPEFDIPNDEIQTLTEVISYEPEQFLGGGSCPPPVTVNLGGHTITAFDTPLYCQFISNYFRPVLLAIAAFTSMMIVAGGFRSV